jgi:flagellar biosynthetic protein FlhB
MSGGGGGGEKTEQPTPKKLKEARKEGRIGKSPDIGAWASMLAASMVLPMMLSRGTKRVSALLERVPGIIAEPDQAVAITLLVDGLKAAALVVAPLAAVTVLVAIAGSASQGGLHPATGLLKPKFNRLNPWPGIKRIFGPQAGWEAIKALVKTLALGLSLYFAVKSLFPVLIGSGALPLTATLGAATHAAVSMIRTACIAGLAMAGADFVVVRRRTNKQLRMTKHEVKQEAKQSEGDPHLKGAIRSRQMEMSRNRMMSDVGQADVIIVNPVHVAVALRYDPQRGAPRVIAKGAGAVAAKIRAKADEHRVPMVQDVPLARALYGACEVGQEVPPDFYTAVATVLAFVMALRSRGSAAGLHNRVPNRPNPGLPNPTGAPSRGR